MIRDGLIAVLISLNIFFHNGFLFKRLLHCFFDCLFQLIVSGDLCDRSASGTVCWFYDNRKLHFHQLWNYPIHLVKFRCRKSRFQKCASHGIFIRGQLDTFRCISRKSQSCCHFADRNIGKIGCDGCHCIRSDLFTFFKDLIDFHDADRIKMVCCPLTDRTVLPCKYVGLKSHFFCFQDQLILKIICSDNNYFFHTSPYPYL